MEIIWAPWRQSYIEKGDNKKGPCILCEKHRESDDSKNLVTFRGKHCFILLNLFPYNNGHLMIAPYRHVDSLVALNQTEMTEMIGLAQKSEGILRQALKADGFNLGINIGRAGGAGIVDHIHLHIVPRWVGDTNFLPVVGETKVISEHIETTYQKLILLFSDLPK